MWSNGSWRAGSWRARGAAGCWAGGGTRRPRPVRVRAGAGSRWLVRAGHGAAVRGTHVLLPAWCLLAAGGRGRGDRGGAGGGGGRGRAPEDRSGAGPGGATVRGWLRRFAGRAEGVRAFFTVLLARTGPGSGDAGRGGAGRWPMRCRRSRARRWRWRSGGRGSATVPVWTAASAASGGLLLAPGWPRAGPQRELTRYRAAGAPRDGLPVICDALTGGGARGGHEQGGRGRAGEAGAGPGGGLFRYSLIREARRAGAVTRGSAGRWCGRSPPACMTGRAGSRCGDPVDAGPLDPGCGARRVRRAGAVAAAVPAADPAGGAGAGGGAEEGEPGADRGAGPADPAVPRRAGRRSRPDDAADVRADRS